jgi:general secretion pathway protein G
MEHPTKLGRRRDLALLRVLVGSLLILLIGVGYFSWPRMSSRSLSDRILAATVQIENLKTALDMFELDARRYPSTEEGWNALIKKPNDVSDWKGPYLEKIALDPWHNPYRYIYPSTHGKDFDIECAGPDGQFGTRDDITNYRDVEMGSYPSLSRLMALLFIPLGILLILIWLNLFRIDHSSKGVRGVKRVSDLIIILILIFIIVYLLIPRIVS